MKSFQRAVAAIALLAVVMLSGCVSMQQLDPNRPLPPQPKISKEVKAELATKPKLTDWKLTIGSVTYRDISKLVSQIGETFKGVKIKDEDFEKVFPKAENPSDQTVENAFYYLKALRTELEKEGFKVVDGECQQCLRLNIDFGSGVIERIAPVTIVYARLRVYYKGQEILVPRDDGVGSRKKGILTQDLDGGTPRLMSVFAPATIREMRQAWIISIQGEKVSMAN